MWAINLTVESEDMAERFDPDSWAAEVRARLGEQFVGRGAILDRFLSKVAWLHFEYPPNTIVRPPLPFLPKLSLDSWVELRVVPDRRLEHNRPILVDGAQTDFRRSTIAVGRVLQEADPCVVVGAPGAGKSTLLRWAARHVMRERRLTGIVPMLIPMNRLAGWWAENPTQTPFHFYAEHILGMGAGEADAVNDLMLDLEGGPAEHRKLVRILLDGWDEVAPALRRPTLERLKRFEWSFPVTMTSRPSGDVGVLPDWTHYETARLTFEGMRELIEKLTEGLGAKWLVPDICGPLDKHPQLREFARNPFVLTLLCGVLVQTGGRFPKTRTALYDDAIELMRLACDSHQIDDRAPFARPDLEKTWDVAFGLFRRESGSPYVFRDEEVKHEGGDAELLTIWDRARLVTADAGDAEALRFLHATVHESLAAHGLLRKLAAGTVELTESGIGGAWLPTLRFAFGNAASLDAATANRLWDWLAGLCRTPDMFGVIHIHAAHLLRETGVGIERLGVDIRPSLKARFLESPDPLPYAAALVDLDPDFAVANVGLFLEMTPDRIARLSQLYFLLPADHPGRQKLIVQIAASSYRTGEVVGFAELPNLEESLGYSPDEASSVSQAGDTPSAAEVVQAIAGETSAPRRRLQFLRLARGRTQEGETYLADRLADRDEATAKLAAEALHVMGTLGARDALLAELAEAGDRTDLAVTLLDALSGMFVEAGAETVLEFVEPTYPRTVRTRAAAVLANCDRGDILNRLADYARPDEPDVEVRKTVISALTRARGFRLVSILLRRTPADRADPDERRLVWEYLGAIARQLRVTPDLPVDFRGEIEVLFWWEFEALNPPPVELVRQAGHLRGSERISDRLLAAFRNTAYSPDVRAAALVGYAEGVPPSTNDLLAAFREADASPESRPLAVACATILAQIAPSELLAFPASVAAREALWMHSLTSQVLIYPDRIVTASAPFVDVPPPARPASSRVFVVVAKAWGAQFGGVAGFTESFCVTLAAHVGPRDRVVCITAPCGDDLLQFELLRRGVELRFVTAIANETPRDAARACATLLERYKGDEIPLVLGHGTETGPIVVELREVLKNTLTAVVFHQDGDSLSGVKAPHGATLAAVLTAADRILAIGPALVRAARRHTSSSARVTQIVPGLPPLAPPAEREGCFRAVALGPVGVTATPGEQGMLPAVAYAHAVAERKTTLTRYQTFSLTILALTGTPNAAAQLDAELFEAAKRLVLWSVAPTSNRSPFYGAIRPHEVALMLSNTEGFGLEGWEAIAAGVPLIVSRQSGLGELLTETGTNLAALIDVRGSLGASPNPADVAAVRDAILGIAANFEDALGRAKQLHDVLAGRYTWERCVRDTLSACGVSHG